MSADRTSGGSTLPGAMKPELVHARAVAVALQRVAAGEDTRAVEADYGFPGGMFDALRSRASRAPEETAGLDMPPDGSPVGFRHNPDRLHPCEFSCGGTWLCTACGWESKDDRAAAQHQCPAPASPTTTATATCGHRHSVSDWPCVLAAGHEGFHRCAPSSPEGPSTVEGNSKPGSISIFERGWNAGVEKAARAAEDYGPDGGFHGGSIEERTGERIAEQIRALSTPHPDKDETR